MHRATKRAFLFIQPGIGFALLRALLALGCLAIFSFVACFLFCFFSMSNFHSDHTALPLGCFPPQCYVWAGWLAVTGGASKAASQTRSQATKTRNQPAHPTSGRGGQRGRPPQAGRPADRGWGGGGRHDGRRPHDARQAANGGGSEEEGQSNIHGKQGGRPSKPASHPSERRASDTTWEARRQPGGRTGGTWLPRSLHKSNDGGGGGT